MSEAEYEWDSREVQEEVAIGVSSLLSILAAFLQGSAAADILVSCADRINTALRGPAYKEAVDRVREAVKASGMVEKVVAVVDSDEDLDISQLLLDFDEDKELPN